MFMIYKDTKYTDRYKVCYFTELDEHNKDNEINKALAGEYFYDGFIFNFKKEQAKGIIEGLVEKLNNGDEVEPADVDSAIAQFKAN